MLWREVTLDDPAEWTIAKERSKNGKAHTVDLHPEAVQLLDRLGEPAAARRASEDEFVFSTTGRTPVSGFGRVKARIDARMQEILGPKFKPWRVHDLRRTCATGMEHLGVDLRVIEAALNHVSGTKAGIVGVHQRAEHREAVRAAFEVWDVSIAALAVCQQRAALERGSAP